MRILQRRPDHGGFRTAGKDAASHRRADHGIHGGEHLPLRNLRSNQEGNSPSRWRCEVTALSRRGFLKTSTAAGAGLVIGIYLPSRGQAEAEGAFSPNACWRLLPRGKIRLVV